MRGLEKRAQVSLITGMKLRDVDAGCEALYRLKKMGRWQHACQCALCANKNSYQLTHRRLNILLGQLDENQRRWLIGIESLKIGHGGDRKMSTITGMNVETIRRGRREIKGELPDFPLGRIRRPGAGRPCKMQQEQPQHSVSVNTEPTFQC
jgi:hypothetical protein